MNLLLHRSIESHPRPFSCTNVDTSNHASAASQAVHGLFLWGRASFRYPLPSLFFCRSLLLKFEIHAVRHVFSPTRNGQNQAVRKSRTRGFRNSLGSSFASRCCQTVVTIEVHGSRLDMPATKYFPYLIIILLGCFYRCHGALDNMTTGCLPIN